MTDPLSTSSHLANKLDYSAQYKAWCLNNGNHSTAKRQAEDWNAKIIWKMRTELALQWEIVEEEIPTLFSTLSNFVNEIIADLKEVILGTHDPPQTRLLFYSNKLLGLCPSSSHGLLVDALESGRRQFLYQCNQSEQRFTQELRYGVMVSFLHFYYFPLLFNC